MKAINLLKRATGFSGAQCQKALTAAQDNLLEALEALNRNSYEPAQGVVGVCTTPCFTALVQIHCQSQSPATTTTLTRLTEQLVWSIGVNQQLWEGPNVLGKLKKLPLSETESVEDGLSIASSTLLSTVRIKDFAVIRDKPSQLIAKYIFKPLSPVVGIAACILALEGVSTEHSKAIDHHGNNLCRQVLALRPQFTLVSQVPVSAYKKLEEKANKVKSVCDLPPGERRLAVAKMAHEKLEQIVLECQPALFNEAGESVAKHLNSIFPELRLGDCFYADARWTQAGLRHNRV